MKRQLLETTSILVLFGTMLLLLTCVATPARASKPLKQHSPDGRFVAEVISMKQLCPYGTNPSRVVIRNAKGRMLASCDYSGFPNEGYTVDTSGWTADSRFFVYDVIESGGHSSWREPIFFYSRRRNRFYSLDRSIESLGHGPGEILNSNDTMELRRPCIVVAQSRYYGPTLAGLHETPLADGSGSETLEVNLRWLEAVGKTVEDPHELNATTGGF